VVQNEAKLKTFQSDLRKDLDEVDRTTKGLKKAHDAGSGLPIDDLRDWSQDLYAIADDLATMNEIDGSVTGRLSQIVSAMQRKTNAARNEWKDRVDATIRNLNSLERLRRQYRRDDTDLRRWIRDSIASARGVKAGAITEARILKVAELEREIDAKQRELVGDSGVLDAFWRDVDNGGAHLDWLSPPVRRLLDARGALEDLRIVKGPPVSEPPSDEVLDAVIEEFVAFDRAAALRAATSSARNARDFLRRAKEE